MQFYICLLSLLHWDMLSFTPEPYLAALCELWSSWNQMKELMCSLIHGINHINIAFSVLLKCNIQNASGDTVLCRSGSAENVTEERYVSFKVQKPHRSRGFPSSSFIGLHLLSQNFCCTHDFFHSNQVRALRLKIPTCRYTKTLFPPKLSWILQHPCD